MRISVVTNDYATTAILAAVKKQQVFADWRVEERNEKATVLSFNKSFIPEEDCISRFRQQLSDEQLREKLEVDFGRIRDMLVSVALTPIITKKD